MRSLAPGNLVSPLGLIGRRERRVAVAADAKRASDIHARRLCVGAESCPVTARNINQRLHADLLRRIGHGITAVLYDTLERSARLVHNRAAQDGREPEHSGGIAAPVALYPSGQLTESTTPGVGEGVVREHIFHLQAVFRGEQVT